jgi:hypothetical protein
MNSTPPGTVSPSATRRPGFRLIIAGAVAACLLLPAAGSYSAVAWNLHVWRRLRDAGRRAPDSDIDVENRALRPFLPPAGPVGFSVASIAERGSAEQQQIEQFLQYSLVPRELVLTTAPEFVIEKGPATAPASLAGNAAFVLVTAVDDDLRLFRRVPR